MTDNWKRTETDARPDAALRDFARDSGARSAALLDPVGRVVAQSGFADAGALADVASLAVGVRASGRRLGAVLGLDGAVEWIARGPGGHVHLRGLEAPGKPMVLLSVFDAAPEEGRLSEAFQALWSVVTQGPNRAASPADARLTGLLVERLEHVLATD